MKYKRKPTIVDAEQWFPGSRVSGVIENAHRKGTVQTTDGPVRLNDGDWVVTTAHGEKTVYTQEKFSQFYEKAE